MRVNRKTALNMQQTLSIYIKAMGLAPALDCRRVEVAWNKISGASNFTTRCFFRDGVLTCTLNSSVVRNQLFFQKDFLIEAINKELQEDNLYTNKAQKLTKIILK